MNEKQRTLLQNKALWLYFTLLADELTNAGYDMKKTLRHDIDIPWSKQSVHDFLWIPVQEAYLRTHSTTELSTKDIDVIFDIINREIGNRTGVTIPFPSIEELMFRTEQIKEYEKSNKL